MQHPKPLTLWSILVCIAALWTLSASADPANGDVTLGSKASGGKVSGKQAPEPLLVVVDSPYEIFDDAGSLIHVAAWFPDGKPAAAANVYLAGQLVGKTDAHGVLVFRWGVVGKTVQALWTEGSLISVRLTQGGLLHGGDVSFSAYRRTESFESDQLHVYTDRGVYEPGDTVKLRSIAWHIREDYTALKDAEVEYMLTGPSGEVVGGALVKSNAFGIGFTELVLPKYAEEGIYDLSVAYGDASAEARLRVERFVPPAIDIEHTLGRFLTPDAAALDWTVSLAYFTGGAPTKATVEAVFLADGSERHRIRREVEGEGPHPFKLEGAELDAVRSGLGDGEYLEVRLEVTDDAGRFDKLTREVRYAINPYTAVIEMDRDAYSPGDPVEVVVRLSDLDRVPVRDQKVRLTSSRGESVEATSDAHGTAHFTLAMKDEAFSIDVFLGDVEAPLASHHVEWQPPQPMRSHIANPVLVEGAKAEIEVKFPANFRPLEGVVHVDVVDTSGSLVQATLLTIKEKDGKPVATGTIQVPAWGSMLLTLFCVGEDTSNPEAIAEIKTRKAEFAAETKLRMADGDPYEGFFETHVGLMTEGQNLIVHPGRQLKITLDGLPDTAAPDADVSSKIRVTDHNGKPVQAALGVSVVDEAVISLKDPHEITPMDRFYNPQLRVLSTTGSEILTWPVVSRNWGGHQTDIALPPFPWLEGGPINASMDGEIIAEYAPGGSDGLGGASYYGAGGEVGGVGSAKMDAKPVLMKSADSTGSPETLDALSGSISGVGSMGSGGLSLSGSGQGGGGLASPSPVLASGPAPASDPSRRDASAPADPAPVPVITIRTEFPKTLLWMPDQTSDAAGLSPLAFSVPDAITRQQITVVASDGKGGVGVLRHSLPVTQPFYVRADLPPTLTAGDEVEVQVSAQNLTPDAADIQITLSSPDLVVSPGPQTVPVASGALGAAKFRVKATKAGAARFVVSAKGGAFEDLAEHTLHVQPSGEPETDQRVSTLSAAAPLIQTLTLPVGDQLATVTLNVAFPALSGAFAGLDALQDQVISDRVLDRTADLIAQTLIWRARRDQKAAPAAQIDAERRALVAEMQLLLSVQHPDGGWGFWWDGTPNPYITAYCVEALTELHAAGIALPSPDVMLRATGFLASARRAELFDTDAIAFWEGDSEAVREGVTAEVFSILSRVPPDMLDASAISLLGDLAGHFRAYLDTTTPDALTFAHALEGLSHLSKTERAALDPKDTLRWIARLDGLRRTDHWEPSWFNAYGGNIEATVVTLRLLAALDPKGFERIRRDSARYLLSTRDGWGGWHNPRGTAAAIRGLLLLGADQKEVKSTVTVLVDGAPVKTIDINPADPFISALGLRALDLTPHLSAGAAHTVEVRYTGKLTPSASVVIQRWPAISTLTDASTATPPTPRADLGVSAHLSPSPLTALKVGARLSLNVELTAPDAPQTPLSIDITLPSNAALDSAALNDLRALPGMLYAELDQGRLRCTLSLAHHTTLSLPLTITRAGSSSPPTVSARWLTQDATKAQPLTFRLPDPITVL